MKKILAVLMILVVLAALPFVTLATENTEEMIETEMNTVLEGLVTEIVDGGFVIADKEQGEVMVNTSDATVWDGLLAEEELTVDQYVFVDYNGAMTFSLPPQVHADRVSLYVLSGIVTEVLEDGSILMNDWMNGDVIVHLGEGMNHIHKGSSISVYHNGVMTLSLPAQVSASHIKLISVTGVVSEVSENSFLLNTLDGQIFMVNLNGSTLFTEEALPEDADLEAFEAAQNLELELPQLYPGTDDVEQELEALVDAEEVLFFEETFADEVIEEMESLASDAEEEIAFEEEFTADSVEEMEPLAANVKKESMPIDAQPVNEVSNNASAEPFTLDVELQAGDKVTVYYNGVMTRSIPSQITALEVVVLK